jgi:hypothetical protein
MEYFTCPHCSERVSIEAKACPNCGSDDRTGWSPNTIYDDLDLPGWSEGEKRPLGFRDTLLWKDFKLLVGFLVFVSFLVLSIRVVGW